MAQFVYAEVFMKISSGIVVNMDDLHPLLKSALETWFKAGYTLEQFIEAQSDAISKMPTKNGPRAFRIMRGPGFGHVCPVCGIAFQDSNDLMQHGFSNFGQTPHTFP